MYILQIIYLYTYKNKHCTPSSNKPPPPTLEKKGGSVLSTIYKIYTVL